MDNAQDDPLEVAADWVDRLDELDDAERRDLADWLARSEVNAQAFATMRSLLCDPALLEAAESARPASDATPLASVRGAHWQRLFPSRAGGLDPITRRRALAAGLGALVAVPAATWWLTHEAAPLRFASKVGERRTLVLPDGSNMILDAASRVALDFSGTRRTVHLEQGAAHFDVRHEPDRPFEVLTPQARMEALGTRFSVDRLSKTSELRVYEGCVRLETHFEAVRALSARAWVMVSNSAIVGQGSFDPGAGNDWQNDWLDASSMPLGQAIERLARYSRVPLRLADPALASLTFSGRFRLDSPERSLELIGALFALRLEHKGNELVLERDPALSQT